MGWTHKGYNIQIDGNGTFSCTELELKDKPSLKAIQAAINDMLKGQIKDMRAYLLDNNSKFEEVSIVNIVNGWNGPSFLITTATGSKIERGTLYKLHEKNRQLLRQILQFQEEKEKNEIELKAKRDEIEKRIGQLNKQLEQINPKEVKENKMILD